MFRSSANLIRVTTVGALTLENITFYALTTYINRFIWVDGGDLPLNTGATLYTFSYTSGKYGIYQFSIN